MNDPHPFGTDGPDAVWQAVARSLAGEDSPEQHDALQRHLAEHPERAALVDALGRAVSRLQGSGDAAVEVEPALARVRARLDAPARGLPARRWPAALLSLAAAIILAIGIRVLWPRLRPTPATAFATAAGEWKSVPLPDGSRVRLGPVSRLRVPASFPRERTVDLTGEAFFEVVHDAARPFTVATETALVRDLGTAFTVRAGATGSRVVVSSGSVALGPRHGGGQAVLRAGDRGTVDAGGTVRSERGGATSDDLAWTQGRLVFQAAPMDRVAEDLGRWYGVVVVVRDSTLAQRRVTATFQHESADEALRVVGAVLSADVRRHGDTAVVSVRP